MAEHSPRRLCRGANGLDNVLSCQRLEVFEVWPKMGQVVVNLPKALQHGFLMSSSGQDSIS